MNLHGLIRVSFRVITAGIADSLKKKYPDFEKEIDRLVGRDPSRRGKYLQWSVKQLVDGAKIEDLIPTIEMFHRLQSRMPKKDINQYDSLKELEDTVKEIEAKKTKRQEKKDIKVSGSEKIFENDKIIVIYIKSKQACVSYGKGTQWCITMEDASYFEEYSGENTLFYFIIRKQPLGQEKGDGLDKVAVAVVRDDDNNIHYLEFYNEKDDLIDEKDLKSIDGYKPAILDKIQKHAKKQSETLGSQIRRGDDAEAVLKLLKPENHGYLSELRGLLSKLDIDETAKITPALMQALPDLDFSGFDKRGIIVDLAQMFGGTIFPTDVRSKKEDPNIVKQLEELLIEVGPHKGTRAFFDFAHTVKGADINELREAAIDSGSAKDISAFITHNNWFDELGEGGDVGELLAAFAAAGDPDEINKFLLHSGIHDLVKKYGHDFIKEFEKAIIKSNDPEAAMEFAWSIKSNQLDPINLKALQEIVINGDSPSAAYGFAKRVPGADIKALQEVAINGDNSMAAMNFALYTGKKSPEELARLQEAIINGGGNKGEAAYEFAKYMVEAHPDVVDLPGLQEAVIDQGAPEWIVRFAAVVPGADIKKLQEAIIDYALQRDGFPYWITNFARVKGADVPRLQEAFESLISSNPEKIGTHISDFAMVPGVDKSELQDKVIDSGWPQLIYEFARVKGADLSEIEDALIASGDARLITALAVNIDGVDVEKLREAINEIGDPKWMEQFEAKVPESEKDLTDIFQTASQMDFYKLAFRVVNTRVAILFENKSVKESIEAGELQGKLQRAFDKAREEYVKQLQAEGRTLRGKDALKFTIKEVTPDKITIQDWLGGSSDYPVKNPDQDVDEYIKDEVYMFFPDLSPEHWVEPPYRTRGPAW